MQRSSLFPEDFVWGVATSAAQIEGAAHEDGKTDSIWDHFARVPGAVLGGDTPETACDHYHRMPSDVALMRDLGVDSYRFSVSWARVRPDDARTNPAGLDFYSRLVDELLSAGIRPWLTLYHWDLPQALEDHGGWVTRDTARRFRDYADVVYQALGDRVEWWTTFNEPFCSSLLGYAAGVHAPGRRDPRAAVAAVHHQHLAHGLAASALRSAGAQHVGITLNLSTGHPYDPNNPLDVAATERFDVLQNRIFLDPILRGEYPPQAHDLLDQFGLADVIGDGDMDIAREQIDFLGVNYYHDDSVSGRAETSALDPHGGASGSAASPWVGAEPIVFPDRGFPRTAMGWEVNPDGLRELLVRLGDEYSHLPPLYVTENGAAYEDELTAEGAIHDPARTAYILDHVGAVQAAISEGADVRGYFVWSLFDNFEWSWGYARRFGIVHVDFESQHRTLKASAEAYVALVRSLRSP